MDNSGFDEWQGDTALYSESQVRAVIDKVGLHVSYETDTDVICYCPFHNNTDSPAFEVSKVNGMWLCFNPSCGQHSKQLSDLLIRLAGMNPYQALRFIRSQEGNIDILKRLEDIREEDPEWAVWPTEPLVKFQTQFWNTPRALEYMRERGMDDDTLKYFGIAYSAKRDEILVPMYNPTNELLGWVARSIQGKKFDNSKKLPKRIVPWNFNNARRQGATVIICESSFDAMRIHQAGYPNVIALLGGHNLSRHHARYISRTFSTYILFVDMDRKRFEEYPCNKCKGMCNGHRDGRDLGRKIVKALPGKQALWASYEDHVVYPHNAKDACDMTDAEIKQCIKNAVPHFEYVSWNVEEALDPSLD